MVERGRKKYCEEDGQLHCCGGGVELLLGRHDAPEMMRDPGREVVAAAWTCYLREGWRKNMRGDKLYNEVGRCGDGES